jgi:hypothetical protein
MRIAALQAVERLEVAAAKLEALHDSGTGGVAGRAPQRSGAAPGRGASRSNATGAGARPARPLRVRGHARALPGRRFNRGPPSHPCGLPSHAAAPDTRCHRPALLPSCHRVSRALFCVAGSAKARGGLVLDEALATPSAFWTATWRSYLVILCLEIGDRTFFIAALLAGKHPGTTVFVGAFGASSFVLVCARSVLLTPRHSDVYSAQSMQARCL